MLSAFRYGFVILLLIGLAACGVLPKQDEAPRVHLLEWTDEISPLSKTLMPTLKVAQASSYPGFDTTAMAYRQDGHELHYFARNRWADQPARMIAGAVTEAISDAGIAADVLSPGSQGQAPLRLDTELIRLEQRFNGDESEVRLTVRYRLVDQQSREVLGSVRYDIRKPSDSASPEGGVVAANQALSEGLNRLVNELPRWQ